MKPGLQGVWLTLVLGLVGVLGAQVARPGDAQLADLLEPLRQRHGLPALGAALVTSRGLGAIAVVGVRKAGTTVPATVDDKWHLGSDTKAMTATMIAMLVRQGKLRWETTLGEALPELVTGRPELRSVTLLQLLSHRAGFPANLAWSGLPRTGDIREQRAAGLKLVAGVKLAAPPGSKFSYSNVGYFLAGCLAERAADESWEALMRRHVFDPLGMKQAGFGGVGTPGVIDQPWPHVAQGMAMPLNGPILDNHPALGPAGTVHASLDDWARFIADLLRGLRGEPALLPKETYTRLTTPPFGGDYALGWIRVARPWAGGHALNHAGDNTMNHAVAWVAPLRNFAVLIVTNRGGQSRACDEVASAIIQQHLTR